MSKRFIFLLFFILTIVLSAITVEINANSIDDIVNNLVRFKYINSENGLPGETVRAIFQDKDGFIWLGLESVGLCRFDGSRFEILNYNPNDSLSLSSDFVQDIIEDSLGNLWIATDYGLNKLIEGNANVSSTKSFKRYFYKKNSHNTISGNLIHTLSFDSKGNLLVGSDAGLDVLPKGTSEFRQVHLRNDSLKYDVYDILEDPQGRFWVATSNGLYCITSDGRIIKNWNADNSLILDDQINAICFDNNNKLWIGTLNGINILDTTNFNLTHKVFKGEGSERFDFAGITCIMKDSKENLWIGSFSYGLLIYNLSIRTYRYYCREQNNSEGLKSNQIRDIYQDKQGIIWIAAKNTGLHILDQRIFTFGYISQKTNDFPGL